MTTSANGRWFVKGKNILHIMELCYPNFSDYTKSTESGRIYCNRESTVNSRKPLYSMNCNGAVGRNDQRVCDLHVFVCVREV